MLEWFGRKKRPETEEWLRERAARSAERVNRMKLRQRADLVADNTDADDDVLARGVVATLLTTDACDASVASTEPATNPGG